MYISLYRRYRPQTFSDMVGQSAAVGVLQESLREGSLGHAYLFSGPRGCGKTSAARLVAKSLDCSNRGPDCEPCGECQNCRAIAAGEHLDVIEIDGASNRGIGEIRDLKSHVSLKALSATYKVYIIDEVHMLTDAAFNALLKTLEEPPANVVFLLATTEPHKVPVTIRSRCQHIPFHRITIADTVSRLKYVCGEENIESEDEAVWEIARQADGALRDALSLTEQAVALGKGKLSVDSVRELTGGSSRSELEKWVTQLRSDPEAAATALQDIMSRGISPERLCESIFVLFRDMWLYSLWQEKALDALETSEAEKSWLAAESSSWDTEKLRMACALCNKMLPRTHYGMKGDVFAGALFMDLLDIINGRVLPGAAATEVMPRTAPAAAAYSFVQPQHLPSAQAEAQRQPQPPQRVSQPAAAVRRAAQPPQEEFYDAPPYEPYEQRAAFIDAAPEVRLDMESSPGPAPEDKEALCKALGDTKFSQLIAAVSLDWLPIAAAVLNAELFKADGKLDVRFERPMPARNFLTIPKCSKALSAAAAKLWGTEDESAPAAKEAEAAPQDNSAAPVPAQANEGTEAQAASQPAQKSAEDSAEDPAAAAASHALRLAGAEVLYIENDAAGDEDAEGNE